MKRLRSGEVRSPVRVVAPMSVNFGTFSRTLRALGPWSIIMSILKSSIAPYRNSSTVRDMRWISSMNNMSPSCKLVSRPARSDAFSMTGPEVTRICAPISFARMNASVVLPSPGRAVEEYVAERVPPAAGGAHHDFQPLDRLGLPRERVEPRRAQRRVNVVLPAFESLANVVGALFHVSIFFTNYPLNRTLHRIGIL